MLFRYQHQHKFSLISDLFKSIIKLKKLLNLKIRKVISAKKKYLRTNLFI